MRSEPNADAHAHDNAAPAEGAARRSGASSCSDCDATELVVFLFDIHNTLVFNAFLCVRSAAHGGRSFAIKTYVFGAIPFKISKLIWFSKIFGHGLMGNWHVLGIMGGLVENQMCGMNASAMTLSKYSSNSEP